MEFDWLLGGQEVPVSYNWKDVVSLRTAAIELAARLDGFENSRLAWYENEVRTARDPATVMATLPIGEPFVSLHVQLQGSGVHTLPGAARELLTTDSGIILRHLHEACVTYEVSASHTTKMFGVIATLQTLADWFGGRIPAELREILAQREPGKSEAPSLDGKLFRFMTSRIGDYLGPLRRIAAEGIAMQMMTAYLQVLCGRDAHAASVDSRERRAAFEARAILLADLREPPSTAELATGVGLSERRLDQAFRDLFGASIFRTLSNARLDHAHAALLHGGLTIKELAFRLGYAHSASFSHAFRARFGVFPSQLRRD